MLAAAAARPCSRCPALMAAILLLLASVAAAAAAPVADWPQMGCTPSFESFKAVGIPTTPPHSEYTWKPPPGASPTRLVASPAVWDSMVYLGSDDGHVYAIDQKSGKELWKYAQKCMPAKSILCGGNGIRSSPAVDPADGSIAVGSYDKHVYKLDSKGNLLWAYKTGGSIYGPATIDSEGTVYVGSMHGDNCLYALHGKKQATSTAQLKWKSCANPHQGELNSGATIGGPGVSFWKGSTRMLGDSILLASANALAPYDLNRALPKMSSSRTTLTASSAHSTAAPAK